MREGPAGGLGKWAKAGVPHKGWVCTGYEDLGAPTGTCEMCENKDIRYAHYMEHADYPYVLACGCVCAEHMEESPVNARRRETRMKSRADRRARFPTLKAWRQTAKGFTIKDDGGRATAFQKGNVWRVVITRNGEAEK